MKSTVLDVLFVAACFDVANGFKTPPMGWNSWNAFKAAGLNETVVTNVISLFQSEGFADAGYEYVVMDEGWSSMSRSESGTLEANATKFPSGIKALATKAHNAGLKLGIYGDSGIYDCGWYPGSWGYEELDAQTWADWGIDFVKFDNCGGYQAMTESPYTRFAVMRDALKNTGRTIFYSLCEWGFQFPWFWADQVGDSFRISGDITASFSTDSSGCKCKTAYCLDTGYASCSILTILRKMREIAPFTNAIEDSWLDMDMLEIGNTNGVMTKEEEKTHFAFWAALKSPLIIGADLSKMNQSSIDILTNKNMIALNQDSLGKSAVYVDALSTDGAKQVWAGELKDGYVLLALNEGIKNGTDFSIVLSETGVIPNGTQWKAKNLWTSKTIKVDNGSLVLKNVTWHETRVIKLTSSAVKRY